MRENWNRENNGAYCYFHPKETVVGVCHLCLNERLLILAAKQGLKSKSPSTSSSTSSTKTSSRSYSNVKSKPSSISGGLPKILALGSFLRHRRDSRRRRRSRNSDLHEFADLADELDATSSSLEDESYISIKFGENGMASWEKKQAENRSKSYSSWGGQTTLVKDDKDNKTDNKKSVSVVEHTRPRGGGAAALRWRKRIGQLLQVIRWRRTTKANVGGECCMGDGGVLKVGRSHKGWITSFNMRRVN